MSKCLAVGYCEEDVAFFSKTFDTDENAKEMHSSDLRELAEQVLKRKMKEEGPNRLDHVLIVTLNDFGYPVVMDDYFT